MHVVCLAIMTHIACIGAAAARKAQPSLGPRIVLASPHLWQGLAGRDAVPILAPGTLASAFATSAAIAVTVTDTTSTATAHIHKPKACGAYSKASVTLVAVAL